MQLVLNGFEERLCDLGVPVIVDAALLVDVSYLEIETPLAGANRPR